MLDVEPRVLQEPERARVALVFLRLLDAAERPGRISRLLDGHSLRDEPVLEDLEVRTDLSRELSLGPAGAEQRKEASVRATAYCVTVPLDVMVKA